MTDYLIKLITLLGNLKEDVNTLDYQLLYNGNYWHLIIEGESIDGEEQALEFNNHKNLQSLYYEVKKEL